MRNCPPKHSPTQRIRNLKGVFAVNRSYILQFPHGTRRRLALELWAECFERDIKLLDKHVQELYESLDEKGKLRSWTIKRRLQAKKERRERLLAIKNGIRGQQFGDAISIIDSELYDLRVLSRPSPKIIHLSNLRFIVQSLWIETEAVVG